MTEPSGLSAEQRFLFDLQGFIVVEGALNSAEIERYREAIYRLSREKVPAENWDERSEPTIQYRLTRPIERDPVFLDLVDHPVALPLVLDVIGQPARLIDNDAELTPPGNPMPVWHRGVGTEGFYAEPGKFRCTMAKCIWYLSDVGPGGGATRIVPGSHKSRTSYPGEAEFAEPPGAIEVTVDAGSLLLFSEACLHAGSVNRSSNTRVTMYFNYGPSWVRAWEGYTPSPRLVDGTTGVRRELLGGGRIYNVTDEEGAQLAPLDK